MPRGVTLPASSEPFSLLLESKVKNFKRIVPVAGGQSLLMEGLPSGSYTASVVVNPPDAGRTVGSGSFDIVDNVLTTVEIPIQLPVATAGVNLSVVTPEGIDNQDWAVAVHRSIGGKWVFAQREPLADMNELVEGRVYSTSYGDLQGGRYMFILSPIGWQHVVDVEDGETQELVIEATDCCAVVPSLRGQYKGRAWFSLDYDDDDSALSHSISFKDGEPLICRAAPLRIQAFAEGFASSSVKIQPSAGQVMHMTFVLESTLLEALKVSVWQGHGHALLRPEWWQALELRPVSHGGRMLRKEFGLYGMSTRQSRYLIEPNYSQSVLIVDRPGAYDVVVDGTVRQRVTIHGMTELVLYLE
jgi:hypothetical protein